MKPSPAQAFLPRFRPQNLLVIPVMAALIGLTTPVAMAQEMIRTLTVTGRGQEAVTPTQAQATLGVEIQAKTATEAQAEVARRMNSVVNVLKANNVSKLQTTGINLSPNYDYSNNQRILRGYTARNTVSFTTSTESTGKILDATIKAGATTIENVSLTLADSQFAAAQKVALQRATLDAQAQANVVLNTLGLKPQQIIGIQINNATPPMPPPNPMMMRVAATADAAPPTPIVAGEQQVEATVTLQIQY